MIIVVMIRTPDQLSLLHPLWNDQTIQAKLALGLLYDTATIVSGNLLYELVNCTLFSDTANSTANICICLSVYSNLFLSSGSHWDCIDSWRWYSEVSWYWRCDTWSYSVCYICGGCGDCHCCMPHHCWLQAIQKEVVTCQSTEWTAWAGGDQHGVTGRHDTWTDEGYEYVALINACTQWTMYNYA